MSRVRSSSSKINLNRCASKISCKQEVDSSEPSYLRKTASSILKEVGLEKLEAIRALRHDPSNERRIGITSFNSSTLLEEGYRNCKMELHTSNIGEFKKKSRKSSINRSQSRSVQRLSKPK